MSKQADRQPVAVGDGELSSKPSIAGDQGNQKNIEALENTGVIL